MSLTELFDFERRLIQTILNGEKIIKPPQNTGLAKALAVVTYDSLPARTYNL